MIKISNLNKYFNKGKQNEIHVINDVNLHLPEKGMVAIFGKSGCGKTTLLNAIGGLDNFESGELLIEGQSVKGSDEVRNKYVGYIFQNYNLHSDQTCFDNVANALKLCGMRDEEEIAKRVISALKNVDMEKYKNRTPDTLSGGQQQRIAIARAIVKNPPVILADEPTGNLDEANTVLVMDLLKKIAKDHLVLIVTHEANLVDHYCDTVIELVDGKVNSVYQNDNAKGFESRDKNAIYLGELQKTEALSGGANVEFYGEAPQAPVKIQIVNVSGKLYLKVNTPKVQILDESSEVKLKEGVFKAFDEQGQNDAQIDMSNLPPVQGKNYGKLFSFFYALKSGYTSNFTNKKKGKRFLRVLMGMFAAVIVFMTSMFGVAFRQLNQIENSYNADIFFVRDGGIYNKTYTHVFLNAVGSQESGIDFVTTNYTTSLNYIGVDTGFFETYSNLAVGSQVAYLDETVCKDAPIVVGKKANLSAGDTVITTAVADIILENVTVEYIRDYEDLINCPVIMSEGTAVTELVNFKIVGIVRSSANAIYLSEVSLAKLKTPNINLLPASDFGVEVENGKAILVGVDANFNVNMPQLGELFKINGKDFILNETIVIPQIPINYCYLLSDEDYVAVSKLYGETHSSLTMYGGDYVLIHSTNPSQTENYLFNAMGQDDFFSRVITPESIRAEILETYVVDITTNATSLIVVLAIMSLCMYFIMRSSLMVRIKEIGVYRAIGVSKKNIIFRFLVEAAVLTTLTVFIGYILSSAFLFACLSGPTSLVAQFLYYPVWLAVAIFVLLYGICLTCGVLPVLTLLSKTPSQILAKYDI